MKKKVERAKKLIGKADEKISKHTGDLIYFSFESVSKIIELIPRGEIYDFINKHSDKVNYILENESNPEILKKFIKNNKKLLNFLGTKKQDYLGYLDELEPREANIERFKLFIFSFLIIMPTGNFFLVLMPKEKLAKSAIETRKKILYKLKEGLEKVGIKKK